MRMKRIFCAYVYCFYLACTCFGADDVVLRRYPPVLNARTYKSASGTYALYVNPTDMYGGGPADYRLTRNGKIVWARRLKFTLWKPAVTDSGLVGGCTYSHGPAGWLPSRPQDAGFGDFSVILLSASGTIVNQDTHKRTQSQSEYMAPDPVALGLFVDEGNRRFTVRLRHPDPNLETEKWWVYDLGSGKRVETVQPSAQMVERASREASEDDSLPQVRKLTISEFPTIEAEPLGTFTLQRKKVEQRSRIRRITDFEFDGVGRICVLQTMENGVVCLLLVDQRGKVLEELCLKEGPLHRKGHTTCSNPAWVGADQFVFAISKYGEGGKAQCWIADFADGTLKEIKGLKCPRINGLAGFKDGYFVARTEDRQETTLVDGLYFFERTGRCLWHIDNAHDSEMPEGTTDLHSDSNDTIALLDGRRAELHYFDRSGRLERTIKLAHVWKRPVGFALQIARDRPDGWIIHEYGAALPGLRIDEDGGIRSEFQVVYPDGSQVRVRRGIKSAPNGRLWTHNYDMLMRLSPTHAVDLALGDHPDADVLEAPHMLTTGHDDYIYVSDRRTKAVHVFDSKGARVSVCKPYPSEAGDEIYVGDIAPSPTGDVYVRFGPMFHPAPHVRFSREGKRIASIQPSLVGDSHWWFLSNASRLVVAEFDVRLVDSVGRIVKAITKRSDGHWLAYPHSAAVAPDGSLAVTSLHDGETNALSTYTAEGKPETTIAIPIAWNLLKLKSPLIYDGKYFITTDFHKRDVYILEKDGTPVGKVSLTEQSSDWAGPFRAVEGRELWIIDYASLRVYRYRNPVF